MISKSLVALEFSLGELKITRRYGLFNELLEQKNEEIRYTAEGEDILYNLIYSIDQDFRKMRADLEKRKTELEKKDYEQKVMRVEGYIRGTSETLNKMLEIA